MAGLLAARALSNDFELTVLERDALPRDAEPRKENPGKH